VSCTPEMVSICSFHLGVRLVAPRLSPRIWFLRSPPLVSVSNIRSLPLPTAISSLCPSTPSHIRLLPLPTAFSLYCPFTHLPQEPFSYRASSIPCDSSYRKIVAFPTHWPPVRRSRSIPASLRPAYVPRIPITHIWPENHWIRDTKSAGESSLRLLSNLNLSLRLGFRPVTK